MGVVNNILKLNKGPTGFELLSFPLMRQQLISTYAADRFTITGAHKNKIDGILIRPSTSSPRAPHIAHPASPSSSSKGKSLAGSNVGAVSVSGDPSCVININEPSSPVGTVLFCCPNAGMYECMANAHKDMSWLGFYTKLGFGTHTPSYSHLIINKSLVYILYFVRPRRLRFQLPRLRL